MDITRPETVVSEEGSGARRRHRSWGEKRRIVEETLARGASVARVAQAHGVNANLVFNWRRLYLAGRLGERKPGMKLLPVRVSEGKPAAIVVEPIEPRVSDGGHCPRGTIHIELGQAQVHIEGGADPALVRVVLECLRA